MIVTRALNDGMIPAKYQNPGDIQSIMNVVLDGVNNTKNKELYKLGIDIYNKYNPPKTVTTPSHLDGIPSKTYSVPQKVDDTQNSN